MAKDATKHAGLVRSLGLATSLAVVINGVVGTGVFLKEPAVLCNAGTPARALAAWAVAGLLSVAGALVYAELATMMPAAGGEYVFLREAFGPLAGFLYGWMRYFVGNAGSHAALVLAFATFLGPLTGGATDAVFFRAHVLGVEYDFGMRQVVALAVLGLATLVNCASVATNGRVALAFAAVKVALVIGLAAGALVFSHGDWSHVTAPAAGNCAGVDLPARGGVAGFGAALVGALWAYNGWYALPLLGAEVRRPGRTIPLALGAGMAAVAALYLVANVAYVFALAPEQIVAVGANSAVAAEVARGFLGPVGLAVVLAALLASTFGALQVGLLGNARVGYAMARDGLLFESSATLAPRSRVPVRSLLTQAQWTSVLVLTASIDAITDSLIFVSLIFYGLTAAALVVLRRRKPHADRPFRVWLYPATPVLFVLAAAFLVADTMWLSPARSLGGLGLIALGLPAYWYWSRRAA